MYLTRENIHSLKRMKSIPNTELMQSSLNRVKQRFEVGEEQLLRIKSIYFNIKKEKQIWPDQSQILVSNLRSLLSNITLLEKEIDLFLREYPSMCSVRYKILAIVHNSEDNITTLINLLNSVVQKYSKSGRISNCGQDEILEYFEAVFLGTKEIRQEINRAKQQSKFLAKK